MPAGNLFANIPDASAGECFEDLARFRGVRIERIVSGGHASPEGFWYGQTHDEWVALACGSAVLETEGPDGAINLKAGDWLLIPAGARHRVASVSADAVWLAVHAGENTG